MHGNVTRKLPVSYLKQKCHFFSFTKSNNNTAEEVLPGVLVPVEGEEKVGKGYRLVNMLEILCTHVYKWKKMIP
jgi:hypothetical protein